MNETLYFNGSRNSAKAIIAAGTAHCDKHVKSSQNTAVVIGGKHVLTQGKPQLASQ